MLIAIVDFHVAEADQAKALRALQNEAAHVREIPDNLTFRPHLDPDDATHVGILHEWETQESFESYMASDAFKRQGAALFPLMTQPPSSRRYLVKSIAPQS